MDTALFVPRAAAGAVLAVTSSTPGEPPRRLPQSLEVHHAERNARKATCCSIHQAAHVIPLEQDSRQCVQELSEAMLLYAEKGSQAEYEAFAALSALVPAEVSEAVPLQIRQLAPRPPVQNDVIDLVQIDSPTVPSATSAATTGQALLANQLCESLFTKLLHGIVTNLPNLSLHMSVARITSETEGPLPVHL